ncbi:MAG: hypothetical protein IJE22_08620 [Oscillibacter sp.]|nr:hypothetical protein [Oscillibacter sp.]
MRYLKIDTQKGIIEAQGSIADTAAALLETIDAIYNGYMVNGQPIAAQVFKKSIIAGVTHPESPVFDGRFDGMESSILVDATDIERMRDHGK